jgi:hypothetical protein
MFWQHYITYCHLVDPGSTERVTMASLTLTRVNEQARFSISHLLFVICDESTPPLLYDSQTRVEASSRYADLGAPREK